MAAGNRTRKPQKSHETNIMMKLMCGRDLLRLGILREEGWNLTAFLDHLDKCDECRGEQGRLICELNKIIGGPEWLRRF